MGDKWRWVLKLLAIVLALSGACSDDDEAGGSGAEPGAGDGDGNGAAADGEDGDGPAGSGSAGSGSSAGGGDPTQGAPGQQPTFVPSFPGAGTSDAGEPLQNGELCDYVPGDGELPAPEEVTQCFFGVEDTDRTVPAATLEQVLECVEDQDVVHLRLTFNPGFVDNTYGDGSIGWPPRRGHRFSDLTKSDHAEIVVHNGDGETVLQFKLDYITDDPSSPSGFGSLGIEGGDGAIIAGEAEWVIDYATSLDRNLNERGYSEYTEHSPQTDESFSPNPETPEWDYRMVYEVWIDVAALGDDGFGGAVIEYVHASPSKSSSDTIEVEPGECPPDFCEDPDGCYNDPPPDEDECVDAPDVDCGDGDVPPPPPEEEECVEDAPDVECGDGGEPPPPGSPEYCEAFPDDPICNVD